MSWVTRRTISASSSCETSMATRPANRTPKLLSPKIAVPARMNHAIICRLHDTARYGFMLSRRDVLWGLGGFSSISSAGLVAAAQTRVTMTPQLWAAWLGELRTMQTHVLRHGWDLELLEIDPPATE